MARLPGSCLAILACACGVLGCGGGGTSAPRGSAPASTPVTQAEPHGAPSVQCEMRDVDFEIDDGIVMQVRRLDGRLVPPKGSDRVDFGDAKGMVLEIDRGEIALAPSSLSRLMNRYVFVGEKAPIGDLEVSIDGQRLVKHGKLKRGLRLPFTMEASVSVTQDGRMRLRLEKMKTGGVGVTGLMDALNLTLEEVMNAKDVHGVEVEGDDVLLDAQRLLPPPAIRGRVRRVVVEKNALVQIFGGEPSPSILRQARPPGGYMYFLGSELNFGKLTMHGADMLIWDADPHDPFHFFQKHYLQQLVAGFSETTSAQGLRVAMPDYDEVVRGAVALRGPQEAALAARSR